ncbi:hypothetical protein F2Q70_00022906 [Brassica cretica]|uniref:Uncharacterized protein n=1 Tax=Brassica cretica TaxID=69181 RepID=A0A8S9GUM9_BRACR|nr:hypothetical protein F2Q70_00022906 [Brassica cretica]
MKPLKADGLLVVRLAVRLTSKFTKDESPVRFINAATSRGSSKSSLQLRQTRDSPICRPFVLDPPLKCVSSDSGILECEEIRTSLLSLEAVSSSVDATPSMVYVTLSKTKRKEGREHKESVVKKYSSEYAFSFENMRNIKFKEFRQQYRHNGRLKQSDAGCLGHSASDEIRHAIFRASSRLCILASFEASPCAFVMSCKATTFASSFTRSTGRSGSLGLQFYVCMLTG